MVWYDLLANVYDVALEGVYREHRCQAGAALKLGPDMSVVDVGCGTGASFPVVIDGIGQGGRLLGVDASEGMLRRARKSVERNGWSQVDLLEVRSGDSEQTSSKIANLGPVDRVLCFLSMSVIPEWELVLQQWFNALAPGGRFVIADVHNPEPGPYARYVQLVSRGSLRRKPWELLRSISSDFELQWQPSSWVLGGEFYVATGTRPAD